MKHLTIGILSLAAISNNLVACKSRDAHSSTKQTPSSSTAKTTPKYKELVKQAQQAIESLPEDDRQAFMTKATKAKKDVYAMTENSLKQEFTRISADIYSKSGWARVASRLSSHDPKMADSRQQEINQLLTYGFIRDRVDEQFSWMKEDVYNDLFSRRSSNNNEMLEVESSQFMDPVLAAAGVVSGYYAYLFGRHFYENGLYYEEDFLLLVGAITLACGAAISIGGSVNN